jgi:hypothetical protein
VDSSIERPTRAPLIAPDFLVTAADDVINGVTSTANDVTQLNNDDVSVTVLKNVVHVTDNRADDDVGLPPSTSSEVTSSEPQQLAPDSAEPTVQEATETIAADASTFAGDVPKLADENEVSKAVEQKSDGIEQPVAQETANQPSQGINESEKEVEQCSHSRPSCVEFWLPWRIA